MTDSAYSDARYSLSPLTGRIIGAAHEVHHALSPDAEHELVDYRTLTVLHPGWIYERLVEAKTGPLGFPRTLVS